MGWSIFEASDASTTKRAPLGTKGKHEHEAKEKSTNRTEERAHWAYTKEPKKESTYRAEDTEEKSMNRMAQSTERIPRARTGRPMQRRRTAEIEMLKTNAQQRRPHHLWCF